jgi:hypothetical protein
LTVYLRIRPKRFGCPFCDEHPTTQRLDWNERYLILQLVNSTLTDVGSKEDVTYDALLGILERWFATTVDWDALEPFTTMGIDEIALLKGHRDFVAVISAKTDLAPLHADSSVYQCKLKSHDQQCQDISSQVSICINQSANSPSRTGRPVPPALRQ